MNIVTQTKGLYQSYVTLTTLGVVKKCKQTAKNLDSEQLNVAVKTLHPFELTQVNLLGYRYNGKRLIKEMG